MNVSGMIDFFEQKVKKSNLSGIDGNGENGNGGGAENMGKACALGRGMEKRASTEKIRISETKSLHPERGCDTNNALHSCGQNERVSEP
ncbi:MAG: hypothetical protein K2W85_07335 [Phycisphaerales bacterium]|nr:hypothetical protein [Phycisphaerales bacterium]